jgi:hypothetical protein
VALAKWGWVTWTATGGQRHGGSAIKAAGAVWPATARCDRAGHIGRGWPASVAPRALPDGAGKPLLSNRGPPAGCTSLALIPAQGERRTVGARRRTAWPSACRRPSRPLTIAGRALRSQLRACASWLRESAVPAIRDVVDWQHGSPWDTESRRANLSVTQEREAFPP